MKPILYSLSFLFLISAATAASAASMSCSGDGMMKANNMVMAMPYGSARAAADKQIMMASTAMSKGDMRGCNKALNGIKASKK